MERSELAQDAGLRATAMPVLVVGGALRLRVLNDHVVGPHRDALATAGAAVELFRDRRDQYDGAALEVDRAKAVSSVRHGDVFVHPLIFPRTSEDVGAREAIRRNEVGGAKPESYG